ncbi:MAG TPA: transposase, partial [Thermoanaerobaculaceae bacterium]|nr:transposase [Thermoanaerobaculaceae bacterium]
HLLMRLKSGTRLRVVAELTARGMQSVDGYCLEQYLACRFAFDGTLFDLDVLWGTGSRQVPLRLVGVVHQGATRWYLTTVPRSRLRAGHVVQTYRLRWAIELLFREIKQSTDLGRSFTAE